MIDVVPIRDTLRFSGELNNLNPWSRRRYLHNVDKQDELTKIQSRFPKGEASFLINSLGEAITNMYNRMFPEKHIPSFWIHNLNILKSIEPDYITFIYHDKNYDRRYVVAEYHDDATISEVLSSEECCLFKLTCKIVDIGLPDNILGNPAQEVILVDDSSNNSLEALIHKNYVDNYKWKIGSEVELIGYLIEHQIYGLPNFQILAMDYTKDFAHKTRGLIELKKSERNTPEYEYWRSKILDRDKVCKCCGSNESLEVHHIFSYKYNKELRINPENGITLCEACHKRYHSEYGKIATPINLIKFIKKYSTYDGGIL